MEQKAKGNYDAAISTFSGVADSDPSLASQALVAMGDCYKYKQAWAKAIECYSKVYGTNLPAKMSDLEIGRCIVDCYLAGNEPGKGQSLMQELLKAHPEEGWRLHHTVGRRYLWQHKYSDAIIELKKAVDLGSSHNDDADYVDARGRLVDGYIAIRQWDKAIPLVNALVRDCPGSALEWHLAMCRCYQGQGKYEEAIEEGNKAVELANAPKSNPTVKAMRKVQVQCYLAIDDADNATALINTLSLDYPQDAVSWQYALGRAFRSKGEYDKAIPCLREVIRLSKKQWEIRSCQIYLGESLYRLGRGSEALSDLKAYYDNRPALRDEYTLVHGAGACPGGSGKLPVTRFHSMPPSQNCQCLL